MDQDSENYRLPEANIGEGVEQLRCALEMITGLGDGSADGSAEEMLPVLP